MSQRCVVIGLGNPHRRDDGVGLVVAAAVADLGMAGVRVVTGVEDPMTLLLEWAGATAAVVVDAAVTAVPEPGRIRCFTAADLAATAGLSSHHLDLGAAVALGSALERMPGALAVVTIGAADTGHGVGLTEAVAEAVPRAAAAVVREIEKGTEARGLAR